MWDLVTECDVRQSQIKGETADEVFHDQCFLLDIGASVGVDFNLNNIQILLYAHEPLWNTEGNVKKVAGSHFY